MSLNIDTLSSPYRYTAALCLASTLVVWTPCSPVIAHQLHVVTYCVMGFPPRTPLSPSGMQGGPFTPSSVAVPVPGPKDSVHPLPPYRLGWHHGIHTIGLNWWFTAPSTISPFSSSICVAELPFEIHPQHAFPHHEKNCIRKGHSASLMLDIPLSLMDIDLYFPYTRA